MKQHEKPSVKLYWFKHVPPSSSKPQDLVVFVINEKLGKTKISNKTPVEVINQILWFWFGGSTKVNGDGNC